MNAIRKFSLHTPKVQSKHILILLFKKKALSTSFGMALILMLSLIQNVAIAQNSTGTGFPSPDSNPFTSNVVEGHRYQIIFDSLDGKDRIIRIRFELSSEALDEEYLGIVQLDKPFLPDVRITFGTSQGRHSYLTTKEDAQLPNAKIVVPLPLSPCNNVADVDLHITPQFRGSISDDGGDGGGLAIVVIIDSRSVIGNLSGNKQAVSGVVNGDHSTQMPKFTLGPNPATELCVIHNNSCSNGQFRILSLSGAVVREFSIPALSQFELDISSFTPGVYMVQDVLHSARAIRLVKL